VVELWRLLQAGPLRGHQPVRVYANSHTFGVEGYVHTDNEDHENYFSTIYYAHPIWHRNWVGDTVFYTRDGTDIIGSVYPWPGRAVAFHGALPHCARAPGRDCTELRVSIVIKTLRAAAP
jgi:SM-20-related protein